MDLRDSPDEAAFRERLRTWLAENIPEGWGRPGFKEPEGDERLDLVALHRHTHEKILE